MPLIEPGGPVKKRLTAEHGEVAEKAARIICGELIRAFLTSSVILSAARTSGTGALA